MMQGALSEQRTDNAGEPIITTKTSAFQGAIDYIFVSPAVRVVSVFDMPYEDADAFPTIPDAHHPSDHIAMVADLCMIGSSL